MTRLWVNGQPITVQTKGLNRTQLSGAQRLSTTQLGHSEPEENLVANEEPVAFTWQGQDHPVAEITKTWRVDIDWWRARVWRAYYKLSTETGLLVVIYQDLLSKNWYLQRLYD